jgi:hypothetical protein
VLPWLVLADWGAQERPHLNSLWQFLSTDKSNREKAQIEQRMIGENLAVYMPKI